MLPIVAFVTTAITRDFEHATASLVFVTPISPKTFVLGRFLGALSLALLIGLAGLLGAMIGTFMPWLDQARIAPFSLLPWAYIFFVVILPSTLVLCAIFFSVAALTRSFALTFAAAMAFFVADVLLNLYAKPENGTWAALADPSARLTVAAETRYWTVAELNTNIPLGLLLQNRLLWLTVALLALLLTLLALSSGFSGAGAVPLQTTNAWQGNSATNSATRNSKDHSGTELLPASLLRAVCLATEDGSVLCLQKPAHLHHSGARHRDDDRRVSEQCSRFAQNAALPADESDAPLSALRYAAATSCWLASGTPPN